jgi:hypothetical protein
MDISHQVSQSLVFDLVSGELEYEIRQDSRAAYGNPESGFTAKHQPVALFALYMSNPITTAIETAATIRSCLPRILAPFASTMVMVGDRRS